MKQFLTTALLVVIISGVTYGQPKKNLKIIPDDYPVSSSMFEGNDKQKVSGEIISLDKVWFTNDTLKQTLVFELYTDYYRIEIFHFRNNDIPEDIVSKMELYIAKGKFKNVFDTATLKQKQRFFEGFLKLSKKIKQFYFTTYKGFKLGDKKSKAIHIYGEPDKSIMLKGINKCEWRFEGDAGDAESNYKIIKNKPLAENSFGYSVTMFFRNDKLIAMILENDAP